MNGVCILPNGNAFSPEVIKSIIWFPGKGVACHDAQRRPLFWIPIVDDEKAKRVRDVLIRMTQQGKFASSPDWSFLDEQAAV